MAFQKGKSGNPGGRPKDKPWTEALRLAVFENTADGKRMLRAIAEKCAEAALGGDMQAVREIGDRLDGKAAQTIDATFSDDRDPRDLNGRELADRIAGALARIEELASGDRGQGAGEDEPADLRKLN
jgi:hypothetical protein